MDAIVLAAVEEICAEGPHGVSLPNLWRMIEPFAASSGMGLCEGVKQVVWTRLLALSELRFEIKNVSLSSLDGSIQFFEDSERLDVKVVADEDLRDNFLGIYEKKPAGNDFTKIQRRLIDRIALSRTKGVTQNKLAKEFNMKGNEIFYHLKSLEYCRLIVRHSTLVKTEGKNDKATSVLNTNLVYLHRYAKHFNSNSQQRIEITMEDTVFDRNPLTGNGCSQEETTIEDISVKDFLPALEAVCNKLEKASGKVLVVKDMKIDLGYRETKGHRAWRNIVNRLKEANLVEEVLLKVTKEGKINDEKCVLCLRLLKKFDPKDFQPKTIPCGYDDLDSVYDGKKGQINERIVELSIVQQIYDMVDAEGVKGMTIYEVCSRLGLRHKKYYPQIMEMCSKYEMHTQAESHNRTKIYRFWTVENFKQRTEIPASSGQIISYEKPYSNDLQSNSDQNKKNQLVNFIPPSNSTILSEDDKPQIPDFDKKSDESGVAVSERPSLHLAIFPAKAPTSHRNPCLELTTITTQRKKRILFRLERDKFLLWADMHNWLQSLEIEKTTKMAKRTLLRVVESLEKVGLCKRAEVKFPSLNNRYSDIIKLVVLHPSVTDISVIVGKIYRRVRDFDRECRCRVLDQSQSNALIDIERSSSSFLCQRYAKADSMRANGFIPAKMVRIKLLHRFLWSHLNNSSDWEDSFATRRCENDLNNNQSMLKLFAFDKVVKDMSLDLFLQVVGSVEKVSNLVDNCQKGLMLSDLAVPEFKQLMDTNATGRLSSIVDVLLRLKLLHLVTAQTAEDAGSSHTHLSYAMELKPYIEVPRSQSSLSPRMRHDFVLSTKDLVDEYWQILEYHYATADPKIASLAFPGSMVPEVFARRSWSLVRLMSTEQRVELHKRVENIDPSEKVSFKDCVTIAKELDLTLAQVLRAFYDKKRQFYKFLCKSKRKVPEHQVEQPHSEINAKKQKMSPTSDSQVCIQPREIKSRRTTSNSEFDRRHVNLELDAEKNERETFTLISQCTRVKFTRQRKLWDDESDRQLIIQYAIFRGIRGAEYFRAEWSSMSDLPADPSTCRRRMASLNKIQSVRTAILKLCNIIGDSYNKYLSRTTKGRVEKMKDSSQVLKHIFNELVPSQSSSVSHKTTLKLNPPEENWVNLDELNIKMAIDKVLQCKRMYKSGTPTKTASRYEKKDKDSTLLDEDDSDIKSVVETKRQKQASSSSTDDENFDHVEREHEDSSMVSTSGQKSCLSDTDMFISTLVRESLSIANAVEIIKLDFLSSSSATELQILLKETLRWYSEMDLCAAFTYLSQKNFLVKGHGNRPFVLSQKFLIDASSSPFPIGSGKRSTKFSSWLYEPGKVDEDCTLDFQCGETFHLFALISSGKLAISICLPEEGIGDVDESNNLKQKGKNNGDVIKKHEFSFKKESDYCLRREKGFPGIKLLLNHLLSGSEPTDTFNCCEKRNHHLVHNEEKENCLLVIEDNGQDNNILSKSDAQRKFHSVSPSEMSGSDLLWQDITSYAEKLSSKFICGKEDNLLSDLIKSVYFSIKQSGEQGLNMEEISQTMTIEDQLIQIIVDTLEAFQLVLKVNAYNCVHIVDSFYKSKYFITILSDTNNNIEELSESSCPNSQLRNQTAYLHAQNLNNMKLCDGHTITILDVPNETKMSEVTTCDLDDDGNTLLEGQKINDKPNGVQCISQPILPWIDGDGGVNTIMYKGLVRRVFGIIMQNPGIMEDHLISKMEVLNPQSCRQLLSLMIADKHIYVKSIFPETSCGPSKLLQSLFNPQTKLHKPVFRRHLFANPMSTRLL